jgi:hypothetical protein
MSFSSLSMLELVCAGSEARMLGTSIKNEVVLCCGCCGRGCGDGYKRYAPVEVVLGCGG